MDAVAKAGRIPRVSTGFSLRAENEQAGAGRDGRTRFARPNSQERTGTGNVHFTCSADHKQDWQSQPVDPSTAITASVSHHVHY